MHFVIDWLLRRVPIWGPGYRIVSELATNSHFIPQEAARGKKEHYLLSCTLDEYAEYSAKMAHILEIDEWRGVGDLTIAYQPFASAYGFIWSRRSGTDQALVKVFPCGSHWDHREANALIRMHRALGPKHIPPQGVWGWVLRHVFGVRL